ncbi:hypothetical protein RJ639_029134 [Escallonia herrerae]|uniref:ABC-type xenobiotic transporter n=1 Tax=Escallonia herrerae TaxID=1293975 RepID=A0AA88XKV8_9ASTE|nr:hypothetical protein RJ639_029134 [Escallonia herrerae]
MDTILKAVDVAFLLMFLTWVLVDMLKQRRGVGDKQITHGPREGEQTVFTKITVLSNILISLSYLGLCSYKFWNLRTINVDSVISAVTWTVASFLAAYSLNRKHVREYKRWPSVLILWWVFSGTLHSVLIFSYVLTHFKYTQLPNILPEANIVDIAAFPLSILLCLNALPLPICSNKKHNDGLYSIEQTLLQKDDENDSSVTAAFSNAGVWSQLTFKWLNPLFKKGRTQKLDLPDIPSIPRSETAEQAASLLEESLRKHKSRASSLRNAIIYAIWKPLAINAIFAGVNTIASYTGPFLIKNFMSFLTAENNRSSYHHGLILAFIFFFAKTVESLSQRQWYFGAQRIGIRVRAALMVLTYKKSLSVKYGGSSNGNIINILNVDVERIGDFCWYIHGIWLLPVQVTLALVIFYRSLGAAPSMAALFSTIVVMVSNTPLANMQERLHNKIMEAKDSRIKATSETLKSMRVLKLHSWESTYVNKLLRLREIERGWLKRYLYTSSAMAFLFWTSPTLVSVATFGVCIAVKTPLTSGTVLSALATFRILQEPIYNLPELISMIAQTKVSVDRIQDFLKEQDQKMLPIYHTSEAPSVAIEIEAGEYAWETNNTNFRQSTVKIAEKMKIMKGYKVAICGSVGSGKSSLLCSMLSEIPRISGASIKVHGSKAFVPQGAWIQSGTVRENVLFGKEMNRAFYEDVVEGCALKRDIDTWADGDMTVIGERGVNLSGGQKQRIQLARAIYNDSDLMHILELICSRQATSFPIRFALSILHYYFWLYDKSVSSKSLFLQECLMQLLGRKTVIYVTHQLEYLDASDIVLVMKDGMIVQSGRYKDLIAEPDSELVRQMAAHNRSLNQVNPPQQCNCIAKGHNQKNQTEVTEEESFEKPTSNIRILDRTRQEETETGRVSWHVYSTFVTSAYKGALVPIILLCHILFQGLQMASNYWIAWGTEQEGRVSRQQLIGMFVLISGGSSIFILGRAVLLSSTVIETAQRLFLGMITSVSRAPLSFFDSTPSSRILYRSSTDQSIVDTDLPYRLAGLAFALIQLLSIMALMSHVAWQVFFLFLVVLAVSIWYQARITSILNSFSANYITTARELARMVGIQKAPILHHFSESINGAATIRCFNKEESFVKKSLGLIDDYSRVAFHNFATMEWLSVRINLLFNLVFFLLLVILVSLPRSSIDPSLAGLAATYGLNLNILQAWAIWNLCNVENKMISVERILQYTNIPSEAPLVIENCRPQPDWPTNGRIELENLHVQYNPAGPAVLKGITCTFSGKRKIGVVGRTGSGKSTLIQALFRVVEPSEGRILIDEVDISQIGLQDLRSRLSIIPQDPILFRGTVRTNLNPLQQYSDHEMWEVLNKCQLAEMVRQDQRLLDTPVAEDGENWSVGQRQLVCLARALLQRRRILVLDEATASVDTATDNVIQKTLREQTSECTVITVAHRIPTVIDNDLVLVLDEGKVVEYDSPAQLLSDSSSAFSKLVMEFLRRSSKSNHQWSLT